MSDRVRENREPPSMFQAAPETLPNLMAASQRLFDGWAEVNGELWSYAQSAVQSGAEAMEDLRQCRTLAELMQTQMRLARQGYEDGLDEAQRLSRLLARISAETAQSLAPAGKG